jgi:hypothetical protein
MWITQRALRDGAAKTRGLCLNNVRNVKQAMEIIHYTVKINPAPRVLLGEFPLCWMFTQGETQGSGPGEAIECL